MPSPSARAASGSFFGPSTSRAMMRITPSSNGPTLGINAFLPPDGGVEVLDLVHWQRVDAGGEVLPSVVTDDEDDVARIHLVRKSHCDRGDGAARDPCEETFLVEQLPCPDDRVTIGDEDLPVQP